MSKKYVPLRVHTNYSLLQSIIKPKELLNYSKEQEFPSVAIVDENNTFAAAEYSFYARKIGYPAILGTTITTDQGKIILYCQNEEGYKSLCHIISDSHMLYNQKYPIKELKHYTNGLLAITSGVDGVISASIANNNKAATAQTVEYLMEIFPDRFFLELNRTEGKHPSENSIAELSEKYRIPLVATSVAHYMAKDDAAAYQTVQALNVGETITDENKTNEDINRILNAEEMYERFSDCPFAVDNTIEFAKKCNFLLKEVKPKFAFFADNEPEILDRWSREGLERLMSHDSWFEQIKDNYESKEAAITKYYERLEYELEMIITLGFAGYYLIVADFVRWARDQNISLSARGSGAGSLVAWTLAITNIDPIHFGLFFERFINPGRVSLPDFDIDFCQERRNEVIDYVRQKYGDDYIAQIITFGSWHARGVLRDVGRVLTLPYNMVDQLCKRIPNKPNFSLTLSEALEADADLKKQYDEDPKIKQLFDISLKLEGLHRHVSTHAAGVIIGYAPLKDIIPLYQNEDMSLPATQYTMAYVEKVGLVKFDFLGLTALTIIDRVLSLLRPYGIHINIDTISLKDEKVFKLLQEGLTAGVFQFESVGLTNVIRKLQPTLFEELIAVISLYRPGPMDNIDEYIARKKGESPTHYEYQALKDILAETFGIIIYQEQVISIARFLAGYTLSEADLLRRAMGKKIPEEMEQQREKFVGNVVASQTNEPDNTREKAIELFEEIVRFTGYAFNKAHAASHALIGYQTAYLKTYYPLEFMAVSLTLEKGRHDKMALLGREIPPLGLQFVQPDITEGGNDFLPMKPDRILYSLSGIKSVGEAIVESIVEARNEKMFKSVDDLTRRVKLNKGALEAFAYSGALDKIPLYDGDAVHSNKIEHRQNLLNNIDVLMGGMGQSLFDVDIDESSLITLNREQMLQKEFKYCGVVFSYDILLELLKEKIPNYETLLNEKNIIQSIHAHDYVAEQKNKEQLSGKNSGRFQGYKFNLAVIILDRQVIKTQSGGIQFVLKVSDLTSSFELFIKPEVYEENNLDIGTVQAFQVTMRNSYWTINQPLTFSKRVTSMLMIHIEKEEQLLELKKYLNKLGSGETACKMTFANDPRVLTVGKYHIIERDMQAFLDMGIKAKLLEA